MAKKSFAAEVTFKDCNDVFLLFWIGEIKLIITEKKSIFFWDIYHLLWDEKEMSQSGNLYFMFNMADVDLLVCTNQW